MRLFKKIKAVKWHLGNLIFKRMFRFWQYLGFHIVRNNFYESIPDTRTLSDELWQRHSEMVGIDINETGQLELLNEFSDKFKNEYDNFCVTRCQTTCPYEYYLKNASFGSVDAEILYSMIRRFKPRRIIEIGSGNSTYLSAMALLRNQQEDPGYQWDLAAINPYPSDIMQAGFAGLTKLINKKVQDVELSQFCQLQENDILFIDSSHVLNIGSDVQYEYLEILPRLNPGVIIQMHDILMPAEYFRRWVMRDYYFWTEQYLLQSFLAFNDSFKVLWGASYMHLRHSEKLRAAFKSYDHQTTWPGSFWIRKTK